MNVKVFINYINGERFWEHEKQLPPQLQISINFNILDFEVKDKKEALSRFIISIQYNPPIGQITAKGRVIMDGEESEINQIREANEKKQIPIALLQAISGFIMGELIIISKALGMPPPLLLAQQPPQEGFRSSSII